MENKLQHTSAIPIEFTMDLLEHVTDNFSEEHKIGSGRYGVVYKGILDNGEEIAVKKLHPMPGLDDEQSNNELKNLVSVQHQNIIKLVGYCYEQRYVHAEYNGEHVFAKLVERALCYEYLEGGSLDKHISDESFGFDWSTRYKIITGLCDGVNYLHNGFGHPIYHLDLKPENILLDKTMTPKIADSFPRLFGSMESHMTNQMAGTLGYMPPEYINHCMISSKFDIFSLGVIIIKIVAGLDGYWKSAEVSTSEEFIELVHDNWQKRPETTMFSYSTSHEIKTCIEIALRCVESDRQKRPTIKEIVDELKRPIGQVYTTRKFTFKLLDHITNHFSRDQILGRGGFGVVYKGMLDTGEEVAVKKLYNMPSLDDHLFDNELNNLMRVKHQNIVRLVGYCHHTTQVVAEYKGKHVSASVIERALCFEYLEGGSLDNHISDESCGFEWHTRYKIIRGICDGLNYLHTGSQHPIYHLDLKPANILLDKNMTPKIGDFGLSRLFDSMQTYITQAQSAMGTRGYMPPEYIDEHQISPKFDIFSLGAIIIRIMAGNVGYSNYITMPSRQFVEIVQENWKKRWTEALSPNASEEVKTCIKIALRCVETNRTKRPNITEIVDELSKIGTPRSSPIAQALECCGLNWIFGCER